MKKYYFIVVLALIIGGFLTSCHDDDINYSSRVEAKQSQFAENFVKFYGEINPNQDWGFGNREQNVRTRTANANANEWGKTYINVPDPLTPEQKDKVRRYFQQNQNPRGISLNFTNFFVQDVYKGGTNLRGSQSDEKYTYANGEELEGSANMDKLTCGSDEQHINNYNNATCSTNGNVWDGRTYEYKEDGNGHHKGDPYAPTGDMSIDFNYAKQHSDEIMLMENARTDCFGFYNSHESGQYNDQFIIIPGDDIDAWDTEDPTTSVAGMFFVGFDFECNKKAYNNDGTLNVNTNQWAATVVSKETQGAVKIPNRGDTYGLIGCADGYYSDWIVRITEGLKYGDTPTPPSSTGGNTGSSSNTTGKYLRRYVIDHRWVFCEDLGQASTRKDFDYNDLVFDAKIVQDYIFTAVNGIEGTPVAQGDPYALITPLAAGGELTITVAGENVHDMFGCNDATMINTIDPNKDSEVRSSGASYAPMTPGRIDANRTTTYATQSIISIPIVVRIYNEAFETLARKGEAPHKLCVPPGTRWAQERVDIDEAQPGFAAWVRTSDEATFWSKEASDKRFPYMPDDEYLTTDMTRKYLPDVLIESSTTTTYSVNLSNSEIALSNTQSEFGNWDGSQAILIDTQKFIDNNAADGSVVRIYGQQMSSDGCSIKVIYGNSWDAIDLGDIKWTGENCIHTTSNFGNYVELKLNATTAAGFKANGMRIYGKDFRILCVSIDNTNNGSSSSSSSDNPEFTLANGHTWATGIAPTSLTASTSILIPRSNFPENIGKDSEIYVYGVAGQNSTSVSANINGDPLTALTTETTSSGTIYKFKLKDDEQAAKAKSFGVTITGTNFKVYYISVKNVPVVVNESGNLWSSTTPLALGGDNKIAVQASEFKGITTSHKIRLFGSTSDNSFSIKFCSAQGNQGNDQISEMQINNSSLSDFRANGYIELNLTADIINKLQQWGLAITLASGNFSATRVAIVEDFTQPTKTETALVSTAVNMNSQENSVSGFFGSNIFQNLQGGDYIRFYVNNPPSGFKFLFVNFNGGNIQGAGWDQNRFEANNYAYSLVQRYGYFEMYVNSSVATYLNNNDVRIKNEGSGITISRITLVRFASNN